MPMLSLYLEVVRQPDLASVAKQWDEAIYELVRAVLAEAGAPHPASSAVLLTSTLLGLRLPLLADPGATSVRARRDDLTLLLTWILAR